MSLVRGRVFPFVAIFALLLSSTVRAEEASTSSLRDAASRPLIPEAGDLRPAVNPFPEIETKADTGEAPENPTDWQDLKLTAHALLGHVIHPDARDVGNGLFLLAGAGYLSSQKWGFAGEFREVRNPESNETATRVRPLGEAIVPVAVLSTYLIGRWSGSDTVRRNGLILGESALFTYMATEIGQFVFAEQRPFQGGQLHYFRTGGHGISGHTSIVAAMSVPLDRMFFRFRPGDSGAKKTFKVIGKSLVYMAPVAVGWSRMNDDVHFAWNVFMGLGTGWTVGNWVSDAHGMQGRGWLHGIQLAPITSDQGAPGLALRFSR